MVLDTRDIEDSATIFGFPVSTNKKKYCTFEKITSEIGPIWKFFRFETTVRSMGPTYNYSLKSRSMCLTFDYSLKSRSMGSTCDYRLKSRSMDQIWNDTQQLHKYRAMGPK